LIIYAFFDLCFVVEIEIITKRNKSQNSEPYRHVYADIFERTKVSAFPKRY